MAELFTRQSIEERAYAILRHAYGPEASFRPGQLDAIAVVMEGRNALVVQKTGWGKSLVYFIATKLSRQDGHGPTIIISPLLALMGNQVKSASKLGVNAITINSDNKERWGEIYANLDDVDAIIISPERLADEEFMAQLACVRDIRLLVVDEAHSISDWGHDFRPDYQRISKLIAGLPSNVSILGTTATANNRVIEDIKKQLGNDLFLIRGDLIRDNLAIQVNPEQTREQRLAWLAQVLTQDEILSKGQGIIYCLTRSDCEAVSDFLANRGISVLPYYSGMEKDEDGMGREVKNLESFMAGETRVLVATVKLGMGYDKSDVRFVIHFQLPQNLIAYYQQIGRAGRDGFPAYAFLLHGQEDEEILGYFIAAAQAAPNLLASIVEESQDGIEKRDLLKVLNVKNSKLDEALKFLLVHDYIYKDGRVYRASIGSRFDIDAERDRQTRLNEIRIAEHNDLLQYLGTADCFMKYVADELDAPDTRERCGLCANCRGNYLVPVRVDQQVSAEATQYLGHRHGAIEPRKRWSDRGRIRTELQMQSGWALCADYYSEAGQKIKKEKYTDGEFSSELIGASADYLRDKVANNGIECIVPIPSRKRPKLVPDFARELAKSLGVAYAASVEKVQDAAEQKSLLNSAMQEDNIRNSVAVVDEAAIAGKRILLVDDMVDSRWTLTVVASELLEKGASLVYPFALVKTGGGD